MLDLLRAVRGFFNRFSTMTVAGVPVDWFFHLIGAAAVMLVASRLVGRAWALRLTLGLVVAKELVDIFAKTRVEYIRPPTVDLALDLSAGLAGIGIGYLLARRFVRPTPREGQR